MTVQPSFNLVGHIRSRRVGVGRETAYILKDNYEPGQVHVKDIEQTTFDHHEILVKLITDSRGRRSLPRSYST